MPVRIARLLVALCLLALVACSTLPEIVPDMKPAKTPTQLDGARGPLSPARSRAILEELERGADETNIFDRHLALEQAVSDSPLLTGNRVRLLMDGPETYGAMFAAILAARDHINMETYIFEDDEVGLRFADALIEKQRQGVQVNLIYDSVGTLGTPAEFFQRLRDSGVRTLEFNPIDPTTAKAGWDVNQRDHRKLLIVDGRVAFLGGINISSVYSGSSFRRHSKAELHAATAMARHGPSDRGSRGCGVPEAVPRDLAGAAGRATGAAQFLPYAAAAGKRGRACDRQFAG